VRVTATDEGTGVIVQVIATDEDALPRNASQKGDRSALQRHRGLRRKAAPTLHHLRM
jgi:hypothetical protein